MSRTVTIHLDEVHLYGVDPRQRHAVADALSAELRRRLGELGLPPHLAGNAEVLTRQVTVSGGAVDRAADASAGLGDATALGEAVARAIHGAAPQKGGAR